MRVTFRYKLLVVCGAVLPSVPIAACLAFRGVEAWRLWLEMKEFTALGAIAWLWVAAYVLASVVTVLGVDDERELKWWEFLIDAGNCVTSIILAIKCANQQFDDAHPLPYGVRFLLWLAVCLIPQLMVTHAARRARAVARHLQHQLKAQQAKLAVKPKKHATQTVGKTANGDDRGRRKAVRDCAAVADPVEALVGSGECRKTD
jgi:hypothetical protein